LSHQYQLFPNGLFEISPFRLHLNNSKFLPSKYQKTHFATAFLFLFPIIEQIFSNGILSTKYFIKGHGSDHNSSNSKDTSSIITGFFIF
jgi:hypothetical protein